MNSSENKKGYGFHPLGAWCSNTAECLAMLLRSGNAGTNTVADHIRVLGDAIDQLPVAYRRKILIRIDGAGATHELLEHIEAMNRAWRSVKFTVGWTITDADEAAIDRLPAGAWGDSLNQDGTATSDAHVAELTGLNQRLHAWSGRLRLTVRRTKPSARHAKKLTDLEKRTGWRYQIVATNIARIAGVPGSHQPQWIDALHRAHAGVEDQVRAGKAMGLRNLPSKAWTVNRGWVLACNIAADLTAWTRLLGLHDRPDLAHAEPDTLRYRLLHLPAKLATHARRRVLSISSTWPWADAFTLCWQRLTQLPAAT
ncbi:transposase [Actinoplanes derwentensis]|uniref:transposase n=1 Tax=Actinoplanes derwentensis TaxID=113562 RepID=UPI0022B26981|nr:transposase [Actinoplanes derwentensis]